MISVENVSFSYSSKPVITDATLNIKKGKITAIIGPNGCGKTTLMKLMTKNLTCSQGRILVENKSIEEYSYKEFSRKATVVSQGMDIRFPFTCLEVVMMGRHPYGSRFDATSSKDFDLIGQSMEMTQTIELRDALVTEISGGEKQRVMFAKALAQTPEALFLDESFSNMDIDYKLKSLHLLKNLSVERGLTVVMVMHDISLVNMFCDEIAVMKEGKIMNFGTPGDVLSPATVKEVFGINVRISDRGELIIQPDL